MQKNQLSSRKSTSSRGLAIGNGHRSDGIGSGENKAKPEKTSLLKTPIAPPIKRNVLIAHTTPLVRFGLASLINASRRFASCGQTDAVPIARAMFAALQPHLVLIGLTLQCGDGFELIRDFRRMNSAAGVLVVSGRNDLLSIHRAFRAGARGYATTSDDPEEIVGALEQIASGRLYASASVLPRLLEQLAKGEIGPTNSEFNGLSDRELQVFSLIGRGFGVSRLAHELHLSVKTIETYQAHLKQKLGLRSASELSERATHWMLGSMRRNLQLKKQLSILSRPNLTPPGGCS